MNPPVYFQVVSYLEGMITNEMGRTGKMMLNVSERKTELELNSIILKLYGAGTKLK